MMGAVLRSLWSLRGAAFAATRPTESAVRYHGRALRGIAPLADVYVPPHATGASVVLVHGGAFVIGSRRMKPMRYLASHLYAAGIAVCTVDYRLIFRGGRIDDAVDDVCEAFTFWRTHTTRHGLDPEAVSLVGLSAGASLAMLAATRTDLVPLARLACCFGLYEMDELNGALARLLPRLLFRTTDRTAWRDRSPRHAPQPTVPTLLLHGSADGLVPVAQAHRLAAHRDTLGLPTKLVIYPDAPHGFFNLPSDTATAGVRELLAHVSQRTGAHA